MWRNDNIFGTPLKDDLKALFSIMPDRIQAAIRAKGDVTKC